MTGSTRALLVTLLVEVPIVVGFHPRMRTRAAGIALVCNVVTNTLLNRVWLAWLPYPGLALVTGEMLSFGVESLVYGRLLRSDRAVLVSAIANLASFLLGPLLAF